ncbi:uncharacterized protein GIQ15_06735 [Arthroderma uncinatum]|uniref:uncharacterized protein n=1 Tax=Arthroderma uncinatum TaxID=74035 RepID=UPI00144ACFA3|nr:uncharacterized protein GIQ15_06735 [Arthroderma uncinatum]KAF3479759.1 hypothetical protein GIQ15_06735 [Arthroderma uncinatum]
MKFSVATAVLALATAVVAVPGSRYSPQQERDFKFNMQKFEKNCGSNNQVSCCNEHVKKISPQTAAGLLPILNNLDISELSLMKGCSKLDVAALVGIQDLLNSKCKTQVSCCETGDTNQVGLVNANVDLKCAVHNIL